VWPLGVHKVLVMSGVGVVIGSKVPLHIVCQGRNANPNAKGSVPQYKYSIRVTMYYGATQRNPFSRAVPFP
jgi:hypothetical protein